MPDEVSFLRIDYQLAVVDVIPKRHWPAHPHALALGRSNLVANPLNGDFALKLREGQEHVEGEPSHAGGSRASSIPAKFCERLIYRTKGKLPEPMSP